MKMCAAGRRQRARRRSPAACTLPMVPCGLSLTNRLRKTKPLRPRLRLLCVARYESFAVNQKVSIFVSYVVKEFAHTFSCAYIELLMQLGSLESTQEARVALDCASSYS